MKTIVSVALATIIGTAAGQPLASVADPPDKSETPVANVPVETYSGYFVSNKFEPNAPASFAVVTDQEQFGRTFGVAMVMRDKSHRLEPGMFKSKIVLAAIKRGNAVWTYQVEGAATVDKVVYLFYKTTAAKSDSATSACPLIVSVPKGEYTSVVFIEDSGKIVKTLDIGKKSN